MSTYKVPGAYELVNVTPVTGKLAWVVLHLRNKTTGQDELTRILTANIPDGQGTADEL